MIDFEQKKKDIKNKMDDVLNAESAWFKKIEELRSVCDDFPPEPTEDKDENQKMMEISRAIDSGIIFSLRQALIRYGNMLFM